MRKVALSRPLYFFSLPFLHFSLPHIIFSLPNDNFSLPPPQIFSTYPILSKSHRVLYSAVTYTLSGCINVHCNRPIPAHPPTHPARCPTPHLARHPTPILPATRPTTLPPTRPRSARNPSRPPGPTSPAIPTPGPLYPPN